MTKRRCSIRTRLEGYSPPEKAEEQSGADAFVNKGETRHTSGKGQNMKVWYTQDNPEARKARYDAQANVDMSVLTLIDAVSKTGSLENGIGSYGTGDSYAAAIMKSAGAIAAAAKCKDPTCCTCEELKAYANGIPPEKEAEFRNAIYKIANP